MEKEIKTKAVGRYAGHSVTANKNVNVSFVLGYDQLTSSMQLLQLLNVDVDVMVKISDEAPMKLGTYRVQNVTIDHDGESKVKFNGMDDFVDTDALNRLVGSDLVQLKFKGTVEVDESGGDEDDEE